jgi:23S rRNA (uridine2552-2'-O)-methyltransferase
MYPLVLQPRLMKRKAKSKAWMQAHVTDPYVQRAVASGYRSRAAYKLIEIDDHDRLLRHGQTVVDLGAAPGSWSQVIAERVRPGGRVIALDMLTMDPIVGVTVVEGDLREQAVLASLQRALAGKKADLVVSDMAPNLSGVAASDQARGAHLCELALDFARTHLNSRGAFLVKAFQGAGYSEFLAAMRCCFVSVVSRKPKASRGRSTEMYLLGKGLKSQARQQQVAELDGNDAEID